MTADNQTKVGAMQQRSVIGAVLHLMRFDVLRSLGTWRWVLVLPIYGLVGSFYSRQLTFDFSQQYPRSINLWDVPPAVVSNEFLNVWFVAIGFMLLVGDNYLRDRQQHMFALLLTRMPSRTAWWIAKVGTLGVLALCYAGLIFGAILVGSLFSVPFALHDSPASLIRTTGQDGWYVRPMGTPMPLFVLLITLYTAFVLWIIGCVVLASSLVWQRAIAPLTVILVWGVISENLTPRVLSGVSAAKLLNLSYLVTYAKHFSTIPGQRIPLLPFAVVSTGALLMTITFGAWRLQRLDA
jgi:hypothetical protein